MVKEKKSQVHVQGTAVTILSQEAREYISLTDIAKHKDLERSDYVLQNWLRNRNTIEFIGLWEKLNNPNFNSIEFDGFRNQAGLNSFSLTPKRWINTTNAIGMLSKSGRYGGGTFAHRDIAFEFATWVSPEFKLYLIKEFQRLKEEENQKLSAHWNLNRTLSRINYRIHTDAVKEYLIPPKITAKQTNFIYANEADLLNMAIFGKTAKMWREENPEKEGNVRDYARLEQLLVLANMESMNAEFIHMGLMQSERLKRLNEIAIRQLRSLSTEPDHMLISKNKRK